MSKHAIVHVEISAKDRLAASKFYQELFGWQVEQMPEMEYATFETGEGVGGGLSPLGENNPEGSVVVYVSTDDIPATLEQVVKLGGKVLVPQTEIPGMGWFGMFSDPSNNRLGLFKAGEGGA